MCSVDKWQHAKAQKSTTGWHNFTNVLGFFHAERIVAGVCWKKIVQMFQSWCIALCPFFGWALLKFHKQRLVHRVLRWIVLHHAALKKSTACHVNGPHREQDILPCLTLELSKADERSTWREEKKTLNRFIVAVSLNYNIKYQVHIQLFTAIILPTFLISLTIYRGCHYSITRTWCCTKYELDVSHQTQAEIWLGSFTWTAHFTA